jgi:hypothetical protein
MATRSFSNKKTQKVQRIPGLTYGKQGELVAQQQDAPLPKVDGRSTNVQPAATNQIDQTRTVPIEEEVSVAMNAGGQPITQEVVATGGMPNLGNLLNLKRPTERPNEALTTGIVPSLTPQEIGDLDFAVLADLADNSDVNAIRQAFNI